MKLYNRGSSYYTIITIPRCLISEYGKKQIWRSLKTKDYKLAKLRAEFETMAIRRKLLNDVESKIKAKNQMPDLIDDDDEETDDIQTTDQMDFSQFTDQDFLNADTATISLMGTNTLHKYNAIKFAHNKKTAKINHIRNSAYNYEQQEADELAYDWLLTKTKHETKRLQNTANKTEERKYYQDLLNAFEYKYTQWDYQEIENEVKTYFHEHVIAQPTSESKDKMLISFDIKDTILYNQPDDIKAKFLSASAQHKKSVHIGNNTIKDYYKIYFAEHIAYEKYCKLNNEEGIAYGLTYKDLDSFMEKKYHLLISIYFTVQNLIRLADYNPKLYSLDNAQILSDITAENSDQNKLLTKRWLKTAWDNHRENALFNGYSGR